MSSVKIFGVRLRRGRKRVRGKPVLIWQLPLQQGRRLETAAVAFFLVHAPPIDATNRRPSRCTPARDDMEMRSTRCSTKKMAMPDLQHTTSHPAILISTMIQVLPPPELPRSLVFGRLIGVGHALVSRSRPLTVSFRPLRRRGRRWLGLLFPGSPVANRFGPSPRLLKLRRAS